MVAAGRGVTRRFGAQVAVDDVSVEVRAGEIVGLIGANGAGKTTFLRCLIGLDAPDAQADARVAVLVQRLQAVASRDAPMDRLRPAKVVVSDEAVSWNPASAFAPVSLLPPPQWSRDAAIAGSSDRNDLGRSD